MKSWRGPRDALVLDNLRHFILWIASLADATTQTSAAEQAAIVLRSNARRRCAQGVETSTVRRRR